MSINVPTIVAARGSQVSEACGWLLTSIFLAVQFLSPEALISVRQPELIILTAFLAAANILFHRVASEKLQAPFGVSKDGKDLAFIVMLIVTLAFFLYFAPSAPSAASLLFLIPVSASVLAKRPNSVLAAAVFSSLAMLSVRATAVPVERFWDAGYALTLAIFAATSVCLALVARHLRESLSGVESLSSELAAALEKINVISALVRQGGQAAGIDELAERIGKIISDAAGFERCMILASYDQELRCLGTTQTEHPDPSASAFRECDMAALRGVMSTGIPRFFSRKDGEACRFVGSPGIHDMLAVPLRVRDSSIGVMCLINGGREGGGRDRSSYCELLASFAATMLDTAMFCRNTRAELDMVGRMNRLMVGRENKMRDIKVRMNKPAAL